MFTASGPGAERTAEPNESDSYQFSCGRAKDIAPLLANQLSSKEPPQVDERANTISFVKPAAISTTYASCSSRSIKPTKQVMIQARLVEVNANPKQSYGINWAGVLGTTSNPQTFGYGGSTLASCKVVQSTNATTGVVTPSVQQGQLPAVVTNSNGTFRHRISCSLHCSAEA